MKRSLLTLHSHLTTVDAFPHPYLLTPVSAACRRALCGMGTAQLLFAASGASESESDTETARAGQANLLSAARRCLDPPLCSLDIYIVICLNATCIGQTESRESPSISSNMLLYQCQQALVNPLDPQVVVSSGEMRAMLLNRSMCPIGGLGHHRGT